jgi:Transposase IS116/IS110/IS902 family
VIRLAATPGLGVDSAQQIIAEVGVEASAFPSESQFASWPGTIPGSEQSAESNHSSRSPKGNGFPRRILTQAAQDPDIKGLSGPWPTGFAAWSGRSFTMACPISNTARRPRHANRPFRKPSKRI